MKRIYFYSLFVLIIIIIFVIFYYQCSNDYFDTESKACFINRLYFKFKMGDFNSGGCFKEGRKIPLDKHLDPVGQCCEGLKAVRDSMSPMLDLEKEFFCGGNITPTYYTCVECGNSNCEKRENWCNCPKDCKMPKAPEYNNENDYVNNVCGMSFNLCVESRVVCKNGDCSHSQYEFNNYFCDGITGKCVDTCGDGICQLYEKKPVHFRNCEKDCK